MQLWKSGRTATTQARIIERADARSPGPGAGPPGPTTTRRDTTGDDGGRRDDDEDEDEDERGPGAGGADRLRPRPAAGGQSTNSAQRWTAASFCPHGMIGTLEVEFFGEPSIILSE